MKKILDVKKPLIQQIPPVDMILSVLGSEMDTMQNIIWENYIKVKCESSMINSTWIEFDGFLDWSNYRSLDFQVLSRDIIGKHILEFIVDAINNESYLFFVNNTYYIGDYVNYKKSKQGHEIFIYGYDLSENLFYGADYFNYRNYQYRTIQGKELEEAFLNLWETDFFDYVGGVLLISKKQGLYTELNVEKLKAGLESLLSGDWENDKSLNGLSFFGNIRDAVLLGKELPLRTLSFPYSHSFLMYNRIKALSSKWKDSSCLCRQFEEIVRDSLLFRNIMIKESIKNANNISKDRRVQLANNLSLIEKKYIDAVNNILKYI